MNAARRKGKASSAGKNSAGHGGNTRLARISHTLAVHLANHFAARGVVLPHESPWICLGRPHSLATKALRNMSHQSVR